MKPSSKETHDIQGLQLENAKLREQVTQLQEERDLFRELCDLFTHPDRYVQVRTENAKLRKLVRNLHACNGSCPRCIELMGRCEYEEQLAEFGIKVDE